ncbi:MAG: hypothetical protein C4320_07650 [Armatimonadota bacterium]
MVNLPPQERAPLGRLVTGMILRTLRARFHHLEVGGATEELPDQVIFVANHNGWHDGYVMFALARYFGRPVLDWIAEFEAFPPFALVGGMPFPENDAAVRATTIRKTIRIMRAERRSLILFAEGALHPGPELLPFGGAVDLIARQVPGVRVIPVAIRYDLVFHERPVASISVGPPLEPGPNLVARTRAAVQLLVNQPVVGVPFFLGTRDVNERMKPPPFVEKILRRVS